MIKKFQTILGVVADGIWGPKSQAALIGADSATKKKIQKLLGVEADGIWGPKSQASLNAQRAGMPKWFTCSASSFADPADVEAFKKCKATGKSDVKCFAVGDNGVGQFGAVTAQTHTPMVALHKSAMIARWGSVAAAAHRRVQVATVFCSFIATVEDRMSAPGRIDLNPACAEILGARPPFVIPNVQWRWL